MPAALRPVIRVAAAVILDDTGRLLLVRKSGTRFFMQAGGKIEPDETPRAALARELAEEIGVDLDADEFEYLGRFDTAAANEHGHALDAELFAVRVTGAVAAASEIAELVWIERANPGGLPLAPLTLDIVLPLLEQQA